MFTKRLLYDVVAKSFNEGKDIFNKRKDFQRAVHTHLRGKFGLYEVSELDLTKFSKNYTDRICALLKEHRNRPENMLKSTRHIQFFSTVITFDQKNVVTFNQKNVVSDTVAQPSPAIQTQADQQNVASDKVAQPSPSKKTQTSVSWLRHLKKKEDEAKNPQEKGIRQQQNDSKGQLISKGLFGILNSSKKQRQKNSI